MSRYRACLRIPGFRRLLAGESVSSFGDGMSIVALLWLALEVAPEDGEPLVVGAAAAAYIVPGVIVGISGVRIARRVAARRLMVADALLRALTLGAIAALAIADELGPGLLIALLCVASLLRALGQAAQRTLVARLVPGEQRLAANALVYGQEQAWMIVAPAVAGLLTDAVGAGVVIAIDAASFAVYALIALGLPSQSPAVVEGERAASVAILRAYPRVLALLVATFAFNALYGPVEVALPLHVDGPLGGSAADLGLLWAGFGAAAVAGSALGGAARGGASVGAMRAIIAGWGAAVLLLALAADLWLAAIAMVLGGLLYGPYQAYAMTLVQAEPSEDDLAVVLTAWQSVLMFALPLGVAVGGPLTAALGSRGALLASAMGTLLLAAATVTVPRRRAGHA